MEAKVYGDEDEFQHLLKTSPEVIPGDVERPSGPVVWCREFGTLAGPVDLLGIGADGSLTVMECKLARNQEIRRTVVGQVLDYASALWEMSLAALEQEFARVEGFSPFELLTKATAETMPDWDAEACRSEVAARLASGSFRLLIAVDELDGNLKRIVRYVNSQSSGDRRLKLVALSYPRYQHATAEILVPETYGDEAQASSVQARTKGPGVRWDAPRFFEVLAEEYQAVARTLLDWIATSGARVDWGRGALIGSFAAHLDANGTFNVLFSVSTEGRVWLMFGHLRSRPPFDDRVLRGEFAARLNQIDGLEIGDDKIDRFPTFGLGLLAPDESRREFEGVISWAISQFGNHEASRELSGPP